jgi:hypothetical protein
VYSNAIYAAKLVCTLKNQKSKLAPSEVEECKMTNQNSKKNEVQPENVF